MKDVIKINAPNNSGIVDGKNSGVINNTIVEARIEQKLFELQEDYIANTDQKAAAYFGWVKHILTLNAGITVLIAALAKEFFTATASCILCLIVALGSLVLAFFYGALGLIGETDYHDAKCVGNLNDIFNQEREHKQVIPTRHDPFVNPKYAEFANHALCFFSLGMAALVLYVVGYVFLRLFQVVGIWNYWVDGMTVVAFAGVLIAGRYWINNKIEKNGFDWQRLEGIRDRLYKAEKSSEK